MKTMNRRQLMRWGLGATFLPQVAWETSVNAQPSAKGFLLNIHFGSSCSMAAGLVQPVKKNEWPQGYFKANTVHGSMNPYINQHVVDGNMIFTSYLRFLTQISDDLCLMYGTPQALDHPKAQLYQMTGASQAGIGPEWAMALGQQMVGPELKNPLIISSRPKVSATRSIMAVNARNFDRFREFTSDSPSIKTGSSDEIWELVKKRHQLVALGPTELSGDLSEGMAFQLDTLVKGLPQLNALEADGSKTQLESRLRREDVAALVGDHPDAAGTLGEFNQAFSDALVLAGLLAKSGVASGMQFNLPNEDRHFGGADVVTARLATCAWGQIVAFWKWIKEQGLDEKVTILITQEFGRSPYNKGYTELSIGGVTDPIKAYGRDHGFYFGMMVIHKKAPRRGRLGLIDLNLVPRPSSDFGGTPTEGQPYTSVQLVGSLLMRLYPTLFPSEREVRKYWPTFTPIPLLVG